MFEIVEMSVEYCTPEGRECEGFIVFPAQAESTGGKWPTVIVHPGFEGITDFEKEKSRDYAARRGHVAFVVDLFGKKREKPEKSWFFNALYPRKVDLTALNQNFLAGVQKLLEMFEFVDDTAISSIGFCFGNKSTLDLLEYKAPLVQTVTVRGTLLRLFNKDSLKKGHSLVVGAKTTVCYGHGDYHVPSMKVTDMMAEIQRREAELRSQAQTYSQKARLKRKGSKEQLLQKEEDCEWIHKQSIEQTVLFLKKVAGHSTTSIDMEYVTADKSGWNGCSYH